MSEQCTDGTEHFQVLDATTGGKHMWHPEAKDTDRVVFADRRQIEGLEHQPGWDCSPDVQCDIRQLPFASSIFDLVAYDPPHRVTDDGMQKLSGVIEQKYGALRAETWQSDLRASFDELWRVLRDGGTLTFKWADVHKNHEAVLEAIGRTPLYGVATEKDRAVTKWWVFQKPRRIESEPRMVATDGGDRSIAPDIDRTEEGE
jgi:SAM-dependent methyltransferase